MKYQKHSNCLRDFTEFTIAIFNLNEVFTVHADWVVDFTDRSIAPSQGTISKSAVLLIKNEG